MMLSMGSFLFPQHLGLKVISSFPILLALLSKWHLQYHLI